MKSILIISVLLIFNVALGRGLNPSRQDFGGIAVPDPNESINKNSPSRNDDDRAKANKYLAELGFGKSENPKPKNNDLPTTGKQ